MPAIIFGSIGSVLETSELQRDSFNEAFEKHGLDWHWDQDTYRDLLAASGGRRRIEAFAAARGEPVDADAVHATKSQLFQERMQRGDLEPREGVRDVIGAARAAGLKIGFATTTTKENVRDVLASLGTAADFDVVLSADDVANPKPAPDAFRVAQERLGVRGGVAIEDNVGGVEAARAAGLATIAFPGANTADHDYGAADHVMRDRLDAERIVALAREGN